jgi:hypothetical protein
VSWKDTRAAALRVGALLGAALLGCSGPLGPIAGGRLSGELATAPVDDWSFTREVMIVQLETRPRDPYSVNVGCVDYAGAVYVGSPDPLSSRWVANLVEDPDVRLRVDGRIYELRAVRVTDPGEWALAGRRFYDKYDLHPKPGRDPGWLFRLEPR